MAILFIAALGLRFIQVPGFGFLYFLCLYCSDIRHVVLLLHTSSLAFFAASTYVWVQYVWHTDKGICAPTIILWVLFVYLEAAVRLRDVKHMPGHLDLCRPFAAHCIGYPVVRDIDHIGCVYSKNMFVFRLR